MTKSYNRTPQMFTGGPFRCPNCHRLIVAKLQGSVYRIEIDCERCGANLVITCKEPIPFVVEQYRKEQEEGVTLTDNASPTGGR